MQTEAQRYNARLGLVLFAIYLLLYGGFVLLNAFSVETMRQTPLGGVNLAILYGFGLILAALLLALLYGFLARSGQSTSGQSISGAAESKEKQP